MFGKQRHMIKQTMYLLIMDCDNGAWSIPEETLWLSFEEALETAIVAVVEADEPTVWTEFELDEENRTAFLPFCFEIMPISISTRDRITWFGKERKRDTV